MPLHLAEAHVNTEWRGKWALITGASAGIGWALAEQLAAGGAHLVLSARRTDRLRNLAAELSAKHQVRAEIVTADLARREAPQEIHAFTTGKGIEVDLLVNNAGFGAFGALDQVPAERMLEMIQVNCSAVVHLTRLYLPGMVERKRGDILIVASTAAFQPVPFLSVYAATKGFDLLFAQAVAEEVRASGVRVCALCPGSTNTEFQQVANQPNRVARVTETADKVARVGLDALAQGKSWVISGAMNRLMIESQRLAPRQFVVKMAAKMMRPSE
jgi:short-subunit dehydrogenase